MGKIKELWNHSSQEIKSMIVQFPCTVIVIAICTVVQILFDWEWEFIHEIGLPFLYLLGMGFFFSESAFYEKKLSKILSMGLMTLLSICMTYGIHLTQDQVLADDAWLFRFIMAYILVTFLCGIYFCYRNSEQELPQYGIRVFSNLIKTHIAFVILVIGFVSISLILYALFDEFDVTEELILMLVGFYYVPSWIYAVSRTKAEIEKFTKILVKFVLLPLTLVVFVIIYAYVLKILILQEIPSNQIYSILTCLFLLAMPTWTMIESLCEESKLCKAAKKLPLCYAPLILLQIYAVAVRIIEFGVTPSRYVGILWILLEVIYIVLYFVRKTSIGWILMIGAGSAIVSLLLPGINMYSVSIFSQEQILAQYKENEDLSEELKEKIYGAYDYLSDMTKSEQYIEAKYSEEEIEEIQSFYEDEWGYTSSDEVYFYTSENAVEIDIQGYSTMMRVSYHTKYDDPIPDTQNLTLKKFGTEEGIITVDLKDFLNSYVEYGLQKNEKGNEYSVDISAYYLDHYQVELNESGKLVLQDIYITYNKDTKLIEELELNGYLLKK